MPGLEISKSQAASEQLATAIHLFFLHHSPVAVHTLAGACHSLLCDLAKHAGQPTALTNNIWISDAEERNWLRCLRRGQNFFKHAKRDPGEVLEFNPDLTPTILVDCIFILLNLTRRLPVCAVTFFQWFRYQHPELEQDPETWPLRQFLRGCDDPSVVQRVGSEVLEDLDPTWGEMAEFPNWPGPPDFLKR